MYICMDVNIYTYKHLYKVQKITQKLNSFQSPSPSFRRGLMPCRQPWVELRPVVPLGPEIRLPAELDEELLHEPLAPAAEHN